MSRFSTIVSTIAALSTIAVTSVTAYKVFDNQQENSQQQNIVIEDLKQQLEAKKAQPITPPVYVVPQPVTPPPPVLPSASPTPELCQSAASPPDCK
jgi:hypothetical protein